MTSLLSRPYPSWKRLCADLGGKAYIVTPTTADAVLPGMWFGPAQVTQSAGVMSAMPEARGMAGLALTPASGTVPYDPVTGECTLTNSGNVLTTPSSALLDVSTPCSLAIIGTLAGASWYAAIFGSGLLGLIANGSFVAAGAGSQANYATSTLASTDTTRRLFIVSWGAGKVNIDIPNKARVSATQAASSAGANALTIGYYQTAGGTPFMAAFDAAIFWRRVATNTGTQNDITALQKFAATLKYSAA